MYKINGRRAGNVLERWMVPLGIELTAVLLFYAVC